MADRAPYDEVLRLSQQAAAMRALLAEWCALHEDVLGDVAPPVVDLLRRSGLALLPEQVPAGMYGACPCGCEIVCSVCQGEASALASWGMSSSTAAVTAA